MVCLSLCDFCQVSREKKNNMVFRGVKDLRGRSGPLLDLMPLFRSCVKIFAITL